MVDTVDIFGEHIKIGDLILYSPYSVRLPPQLGQVVRFTPKMVEFLELDLVTGEPLIRYGEHIKNMKEQTAVIKIAPNWIAIKRFSPKWGRDN